MIEDKDLGALHDWARELKEDGVSRRKHHEAQWWENIATYAGDLWVEFDVTRRKLVEGSKENHRVRLPINLAMPAVRTEYAKLLKNRPMVNCVARSADLEDIQAAEVGDKMLNDYGEKQYHKGRVRRRMLQWVLLTGIAGYFVDWDENALGETEIWAHPDGTPITEENELAVVQEMYDPENPDSPSPRMIPKGDMVHKALGPFNFIWDFSQIYFDDAKWCCITEVYDVDEVFRRWGVEVEEEKDVKAGVIEQRILDRAALSTAFEFKAPTAQKLVAVNRLFVRPGNRWFENGAEIVFTENEMISATDFPHTHGELPLSVMGHIFQPTSQYPMSIVQQVRPIVLEVSKTVSQMIENRNLMANPAWIEFRQNRIEGEIINKPGARLKVDYLPNVPEPHPVEMPDLPGYVQALPEMMRDILLEITGQNETSQGQVPPGARSGVAIAYLTEENDTKLGPTVQELEEVIERASWLELLTYAQYFDVPRQVQIYKKNSEPEVFNFKGNMVSGVAGVTVQAGSALPRSLAAKQQFTMDLYDRGLIRNPRQVMEMLEVGQGERDEWEDDMDQAERENLRLRKGEHIQPREWENHAAHLYVHHKFMKSAEFDELGEEVKQAFEAHEADHQNEIKNQQAQQMMMMGPGGGGAPTAAPGPTGGAGTDGAATAPGMNQPAPSGAYASPDMSSATQQQDYSPQ
jgi:hypothetical protein